MKTFAGFSSEGPSPEARLARVEKHVNTRNIGITAQKPSSSARSSFVSVIGVASGMPLMHPRITTNIQE